MLEKIAENSLDIRKINHYLLNEVKKYCSIEVLRSNLKLFFFFVQIILKTNNGGEDPES